MPRLFRNQREQAIGRAGHSAQIVANAYNVNLRTLYRLHHRYNTTNNTNARPRSGRPRVTTPRQDPLFCANICKTDSPQQLRRLVIPLEHSNDPSMPTPSGVAWSPTISIVDVLLEVLFLQTVTDRNDCSGPQLVNIGAISHGEESSSRMKVGSVFRRRMAEYGSGEEEVNVTQMHV